MPRITPTQFNYGRAEGMQLRSGTIINHVANSQLGKDAAVLFNGDCDVDTPQYGYCKKCFTIFTMFDFLEKHHKQIRCEEITVHGKTSTWIALHKVIREKLEEFIHVIDTKGVDCSCEDQDWFYNGAIYNNICFMLDLSEQPEYIKMANYTGYGREREKYRIYHKNFFEYEVTENGLEIIGRNFHRVREELAHWLKYFKRSHQTVIDNAKKELTAHKRVAVNDDCITEILSFL